MLVPNISRQLLAFACPCFLGPGLAVAVARKWHCYIVLGVPLGASHPFDAVVESSFGNGLFFRDVLSESREYCFSSVQKRLV